MAKKKDTAEVEEKAEAPATAEETVEAEVAVEETVDVSGYTVEEVQAQLKPLSQNAFVRFWQKILRWWLGVWYGFSDKHPKLAPWIYKIFFFIVFSYGVTIWQFIVMAFLPYAFSGMGTDAVGWPNIPLVGKQMFVIFGDNNGWGPFIAFEIAVFTAQCINFPLQRNITYRSHGNPWYQAMWYFIGWVLVSLFTNTIWGVCNAYLTHWGCPEIVNALLKTILTGGVSMVIFFFIFMVIFPDNNKMAKKARAKYEKLVAANASAEKIAKAEAKMNLWETKAKKSNAESEYFKAKSQLNAAVMKYNTYVKASEKAAAEAQKAEEAAQAQNTEKATAKAAEAKQKAEVFPAKIEKAFETAVLAIKTRDEKKVVFEEAQAL